MFQISFAFLLYFCTISWLEQKKTFVHKNTNLHFKGLHCCPAKYNLSFSFLKDCHILVDYWSKQVEHVYSSYLIPIRREIIQIHSYRDLRFYVKVPTAWETMFSAFIEHTFYVIFTFIHGYYQQRTSDETSLIFLDLGFSIEMYFYYNWFWGPAKRLHLCWFSAPLLTP